MSNVRVSQGLQAPISEQQLSEPMIVAQIGARIAQHPRAVNWHELASDYERIRDVIEFCQRGVTEGFEQFNQRLNQRGRISLPNPAARREWKTATGKAQFMVHATVVDSPLRRARQQRGSSVLALMTVRSHDQFNTTVYSNDDRYRGVFGNRRVIFMHAQDLQDRGLCAGDRVDIESISEDGVQRQLQGFTAIAYDVPRSCAAAYFPEATALVSSASFSAHTQTPLYKEVPVMVRPASSAAG